MFILKYNDLTQEAKTRLAEYITNLLLEDFKKQTEYTEVEEYINDNLENKLFQLSHSLDSVDRIEFMS